MVDCENLVNYLKSYFTSTDDLLDTVYPVGSIYMSVNSTSPADLFGGTWEQIKDTFLLSCGDTYSNGATGGEATHTLTVSEMPSHTHIQNQHRHTEAGNWSTGSGSTSAYTTTANREGTSLYTNWATATNQNTGGGQAHNNMPPYLAVYVWKRVPDEE